MRSSSTMKYKGVLTILLLVIGIPLEHYSGQIKSVLNTPLYYIVECITVSMPIAVIIVITRKERYFHANQLMKTIKILYTVFTAVIIIGAFINRAHDDFWMASAGRYLMISNIILLLYLIGYEIYYAKRHWI